MKDLYVYPSTEIVVTDMGVMDIKDTVYHKGITLRDHFAGLALQGILSSGRPFSEQNSAMKAYEYADEMLEERDKSSQI